MEGKHAILDAGIPDALHVLCGAKPQVAHTSTPKSRRRKMDDAARPQPRSSTVVSHSVSQSEFAPPLAFARTHSGWYCEDRGNRSDTSRSSEAM